MLVGDYMEKLFSSINKQIHQGDVKHHKETQNILSIKNHVFSITKKHTYSYDNVYKVV